MINPSPAPGILPETISVALAIHRALDVLSAAQAMLAQTGATYRLTISDAHNIIGACNEQRRQMDETEDTVDRQAITPLFRSLRIGLTDMADFVARALRYENHRFFPEVLSLAGSELRTSASYKKFSSVPPHR
jgi:acyl-coenzyme A synthetase/AMP-(fatty) acid ligase